MRGKPAAQGASLGRLWDGAEDADRGGGCGVGGEVGGAMQEARALQNLGRIGADDEEQGAWIDVDLFKFTTSSEGRTSSHGHRAATPSSRPSTSTQSSREHSWHLKRSWARPSQQHDKNAWILGSELMKLKSEHDAVHDARRTGSTIRQLTATCMEAQHLDPSTPAMIPQLWRADFQQQEYLTPPPDSKQLRQLAMPRAAPRHVPEHHWTAPGVLARPRPSTTTVPPSFPLPPRCDTPKSRSRIRTSSRGSMRHDEILESSPNATLQLCMHLLPRWEDAHGKAR